MQQSNLLIKPSPLGRVPPKGAGEVRYNLPPYCYLSANSYCDNTSSTASGPPSPKGKARVLPHQCNNRKFAQKCPGWWFHPGRSMIYSSIFFALRFLMARQTMRVISQTTPPKMISWGE